MAWQYFVEGVTVRANTYRYRPFAEVSPIGWPQHVRSMRPGHLTTRSDALCCTCHSRFPAVQCPSTARCTATVAQGGAACQIPMAVHHTQRVIGYALATHGL